MCDTWLAVAAERFPSWQEVQREKNLPIPEILIEDRRPYRRGGSGLTRLETLLLQVQAGRRD